MKVLLVNEHQLLQNLLHIALERKEGIEIVGEFLRGEEALAAVGETAPDLVILGMALPDVDGLTLTVQILKRAPGTQLLAVTSQKESQYLVPFLLLGGRGYMSQYPSDEEFYRAVDAVMAGGVYLSGSGETVLDEMCAQLEHLKRQAAAARDPKAADDLSSGESAGPALPLYPGRELSDRERQILHLYVNGYKSSEIAGILYLSVNTVETHKKRVKEKLQLTRKADLTQYAKQHGLFEDWD